MEEAAWAPLFEVEASRVAGDGGEKLEPVAVSGTGDIKILFLTSPRGIQVYCQAT